MMDNFLKISIDREKMYFQLVIVKNTHIITNIIARIEQAQRFLSWSMRFRELFHEDR